MSVRVFICARPSCGKGRETDIESGGACPYCGGRKWEQVARISFRDTLRFLWRYKGKYLIIDTHGWPYKVLAFCNNFGRKTDDQEGCVSGKG